MALRRWVSLGLAVVGGLGLVLLILLGRDLFESISWPVRKGMGWTAFAVVTLVLGARIFWIRPGDEPVPGDEPSTPSPRWLAWVGPGLIAALAWPLLQHPENLGFGDWDWFLTKYEAARRTILVWGEVPWWDPWTRGGFPLAANPQFGLAGVAMPLVLVFGTSVGMRLATLVCFGLAVEGARRLARFWLDDPYAAALAGVIYGLNGGVLVTAVAGYHLSMCYPALPWMLWLVFRLERRPTNGLWLGFWGAFNVLNGIQYFTVYTALIVGVVWVRALRTRPRSVRGRFLAHSVLALGTYLGLAGWRLATTGLVYLDFPRKHISWYEETPRTILEHLLGRPTGAFLARTSIPHFWETTCYIGPVVVVMALLSVRRGWRWWHTLAVVCGWLASGSVSWHHPSYWLGHIPGFATMHAVPRWRFMALLGVALAASSEIAAWRRDPQPRLRVLATVALVAILADYVALGYEVLPVAFSIAPREAVFPGPMLTEGPIEQIGEWDGYAALLRGRGVIRGYEPMLGYNRSELTSRRFRGSTGYAGEHWTANGPARVVSWSPNRIVLDVEPGEVVAINQNPGSWWWLNDRQAFPRMRCAEKNQEFTVVANDQGRVDLQIHPRGLTLGYGLHLFGAVLVAVTWLGLRETGRRQSSENRPDPVRIARIDDLDRRDQL